MDPAASVTLEPMLVRHLAPLHNHTQRQHRTAERESTRMAVLTCSRCLFGHSTRMLLAMAPALALVRCSPPVLPTSGTRNVAASCAVGVGVGAKVSSSPTRELCSTGRAEVSGV